MTGSGKEEPCLYKKLFCFSQRHVGRWQRPMDAGVFLHWKEELSQTHLGGFVQRIFAALAWNRLELCAFVGMQKDE